MTAITKIGYLNHRWSKKKNGGKVECMKEKKRHLFESERRKYVDKVKRNWQPHLFFQGKMAPFTIIFAFPLWSADRFEDSNVTLTVIWRNGSEILTSPVVGRRRVWLIPYLKPKGIYLFWISTPTILVYWKKFRRRDVEGTIRGGSLLRDPKKSIFVSVVIVSGKGSCFPAGRLPAIFPLVDATN